MLFQRDVNLADNTSVPKPAVSARQNSGASSQPAGSRDTQKKPEKRRRLLLFAALGAIALLLAGGFTYWRLFIWQPAVVNPFSNRVIASLKFPLYYPTALPRGYRIDTKSVSIPQTGVVTFDLIGPRGGKIYISEEDRPSTFNLGGFYKAFSGLKLIPDKNGEIAVGHLNNKTEVIGSLAFASTNTWVIINAHSSVVQPTQLTSALESLTLSD